jgi:hypothetical protein
MAGERGKRRGLCDRLPSILRSRSAAPVAKSFALLESVVGRDGHACPGPAFKRPTGVTVPVLVSPT